MSRSFNTTGICVPEMDYMADISGRVAAAKAMVNQGLYFAISRPRQFGKSTLIAGLERELSKDMHCASISFEWSDDESFGDSEKFCSSFIGKVYEALDLKALGSEALDSEAIGSEALGSDWLKEDLKTFDDLDQQITKLCKNRKVALIIDEADCAYRYKPFFDFISLLRDKLLQRERGAGATFQSVMLVGLHDLKTFAPQSSWSIAAPFQVDMSLSQAEILGMLECYESDHSTGMDAAKISELIFDYTAGYPFLVSNICKLMAERIGWSLEGVLEAVKRIVKDSPLCTLLDDVAKFVLSNDPIRDLIYEILFEGKEKPFANSDPNIQRAEALGLIRAYPKIISEAPEKSGVEAFARIFPAPFRNFGICTKEKNGCCAVSNRIFEIFISRLMASRFSNASDKSVFGSPGSAIDESGRFSMELCLAGFAEDFGTVFTSDDAKYLEDNGRMVFVLYLLGMTSGTGFFQIESRFTDEEKMGVIVDSGPKQYVIEVRSCHGKRDREKAYEQLRGHLDKKEVQEGYLLTLNLSNEKDCSPEAEWVRYKDVRIYDVVV